MVEHKGTVDQGIEHLLVHGLDLVHGGQAAAARAIDCCPVALNRAIKRLKDAGAWEEHASDVLQTYRRANPDKSLAASGKRVLKMPTPRSLGKQIKEGANRLGDGRPYGGKGNTWGERREGHKIATNAIAAAGVTVANAAVASERLAEAGVRISTRTLFDGDEAKGCC